MQFGYFERGVLMALVEVNDNIITSTIDNLTLYYDVAYKSGETNLPVLIWCYPWSNDKTTMDSEIRNRLADHATYPVFLICVNFRGKGSSGGSRDVGAKELHDIYDCLQDALTTYSSVVDSSNVSAVGYSGGGGNVLSLVTKFPHILGIAVNHFGISDYGYDETDGWYQNTTSSKTDLEAFVGDTPSNVPNKYRARMSVAGVKNNTNTRVRLFHDEQDGTVLVAHSDNWKTEADNIGYTNYVLSKTGSGDDPRWTHGIPNLSSAGEDNIQTEDIWLPEIYSKNYLPQNTPDSGDIFVLGYIMTDKFKVEIRDLESDTLNGSYDFSGKNEIALNNNDTALTTYVFIEVYGLTSDSLYTVSSVDWSKPVRSNSNGVARFYANYAVNESKKITLTAGFDREVIG